MGSTGDSPVPVGDPPSGTRIAKRPSSLVGTLLPFRSAGRQAGRLCYQETIFKIRSKL